MAVTCEDHCMLLHVAFDRPLFLRSSLEFLCGLAGSVLARPSARSPGASFGWHGSVDNSIANWPGRGGGSPPPKTIAKSRIFAKGQRRVNVRGNSPIPKGLCNKAQGCEERATLGDPVPIYQPQPGLRHARINRRRTIPCWT